VGPMEEFYELKAANIGSLGADAELREISKNWFIRASKRRYSYHFSWLGLPIIQFPQDIVALQEVIWAVKPDAIVETGIAHGGSLVFHASMMALLGGNGIVVGVDIDIRSHNRAAIDEHPLSSRIKLVEGSSIDRDAFKKIEQLVAGRRKLLVILDSLHEADHVLEELRLYQSLVGAGSYIIVLDTIIDDMPAAFSEDKPWTAGRGPKIAVHKFLNENKRFEIDTEFNDKLLISVAPDGFLRCTSDK
jgi:cephalosporin hydroxylase